MDLNLADVVEQYHRAVAAFVRGDSSHQELLFSERDDVTLANPLGPPARGRSAVLGALRRASAQASKCLYLGIGIAASVCGSLLNRLRKEKHQTLFGVMTST